VSEETGLSLSTVSRIMRDLTEERMLDRLDDGSYMLGFRVFRLVRSARESSDPMAVIHRMLADLRDRTGETVSLNVRQGDNRVCIASANSRAELRRVVPVGDVLPLVGTASGDVLLATLPADEQLAVIRRAENAEPEQDLLDRLQRTAARGWSARSDSLVAGVTGVAVPVWSDGDEKVIAALTLSSPTSRMSLDAAEKWVPDMENVARRLSPWVEPF
jgi:IclR family acetate operon transcriptional repressor